MSSSAFPLRNINGLFFLVSLIKCTPNCPVDHQSAKITFVLTVYLFLSVKCIFVSLRQLYICFYLSTVYLFLSVNCMFVSIHQLYVCFYPSTVCLFLSINCMFVPIHQLYVCFYPSTVCLFLSINCMFVPIFQLERYSYLVDLLVNCSQPVLIVGETGVGKSSLIQVRYLLLLRSVPYLGDHFVASIPSCMPLLTLSHIFRMRILGWLSEQD